MNATDLINRPFIYQGCYGRVAEQNGGVIYFKTPHGTTIKMGVAWFVLDSTPITEPRDLEILARWERMAEADGVLYGNDINANVVLGYN